MVAGGLHPAIRAQYFRVGHMGVAGEAEILTTLGAIERALVRSGAKIELGSGIQAAQHSFAAR